MKISILALCCAAMGGAVLLFAGQAHAQDDHVSDELVRIFAQAGSARVAGDDERAIAEYDFALERSRTSYERLVTLSRKANVLDHMGRPAVAIQTLQQALSEPAASENGRKIRLLLRIGYHQLDLDRYEQAAASFDKAMRAGASMSAGLSQAMAAAYANSGQERKAAEAVERALILARRDEREDFGALAQLYGQLGMTRERDAILAEAARKWPGYDPSRNYLNDKFYELKAVHRESAQYPPDAIAASLEGGCSVVADVIDGELANLRASSCSHGVFEDASLAAAGKWRFEKESFADWLDTEGISVAGFSFRPPVSRQSPGELRQLPNVNRAVAAKQYDQAISIIDGMLKGIHTGAPERFLLMQRRGQILKDSGQPDQALQTWKQAMTILPDLVASADRASLLSEIGRLEMREGRPGEAAAFIAEQRSADPFLESEPLATVQALALAQPGDIDAAIPYAEEALELASPKAKRHFALLYTLYNKAGMAEEAAGVETLIRAYAGQPVDAVAG